jgi:hypothetical protein
LRLLLPFAAFESRRVAEELTSPCLAFAVAAFGADEELAPFCLVLEKVVAGGGAFVVNAVGLPLTVLRFLVAGAYIA